MTQGEARTFAREVNDTTELIAVADTIRATPTGLVRGGWTTKHTEWAVFEYGTNRRLDGVQWT